MEKYGRNRRKDPRRARTERCRSLRIGAVGALASVLLLGACTEDLDFDSMHRNKAIRTVQSSSEWKGSVERMVMRAASVDEHRWHATRAAVGLREGEWYVGLVDQSDRGHFFIANIDTGKVVHINTDMLAAYRVGHLKPHPSPHLKVEIENSGFERCRSWSTRGWCWVIAGSATNSKAPIVGLDAEVDIVLQTSGKTIDGEWSGSAPDPFRRTSESRPWLVGEKRTFKYRSNIIPDVYATPGVSGEGIVAFSVAVETVAQPKTAEHLEVRKFAWPGALADGPQLPWPHALIGQSVQKFKQECHQRGYKSRSMGRGVIECASARPTVGTLSARYAKDTITRAVLRQDLPVGQPGWDAVGRSLAEAFGGAPPKTIEEVRCGGLSLPRLRWESDLLLTETIIECDDRLRIETTAKPDGIRRVAAQ